MLLFCSFSLVFQWRSGKIFLPIFTKFGRMLSYHEDLPLVKSYDSLMKWSSEITWQLTMNLTSTKRSMGTKFPRSRDKTKPLYLHYHSAHDHQTWQDAELHRATATHKLTWPVGRAFEWSRDKLKPLHFFHKNNFIRTKVLVLVKTLKTR